VRADSGLIDELLIRFGSVLCDRTATKYTSSQIEIGV